MDCKEINELLTGYIEGELPPDKWSAVEAHLRGCTSCRQEVESLKACRDKLKLSLGIAAGSVTPPRDALLAIRQRSGIKEDNDRENILGWHPADSLVGVLLSFLVVFMTLFSLLPFVGGMAGPPPDAPVMVSDGVGGVYLYWLRTEDGDHAGRMMLTK